MLSFRVLYCYSVYGNKNVMIPDSHRDRALCRRHRAIVRPLASYFFYVFVTGVRDGEMVARADIMASMLLPTR